MEFSAKYAWLGLAVLLAFAPAAFAQDAGDGTLHVVRPIIHADQEEAELCLEFDHDLDASDHAHIASAVKLESAGHAIAVKAQGVAVLGNTLCVPSLEHRKDYRIVVNGVRGAKGEKLASAYGFSFTVPDRAAALGFTGGAANEGMRRWRDEDPVLRALNVPYVHLELYRVEDPAMMAAAWRDRQQTALAPSESATFGHDHGRLAWSGDLAFDGEANKPIEHAVALNAGMPDAPNGLYLLIARGPEPKAEPKPVVDEETGTKAAPLAPTAAAWLLRSDLRLSVARDNTGFYGFVEKTADAARVPVKDVRLAAEDANAVQLADTRSDDNGIGHIALDPGKLGGATALAAFTDGGDVDFADVNAASVVRLAAPQNMISVAPAKPFYLPAAQASIAFTAHDARGNALNENGTTLALLANDGSTFMELPVPATTGGTAHLEFAAPAVTGVWPLVWRQGDRTLAQASLRVAADATAPRIDVTTDKQGVSRDGGFNLALKSLKADNAPAPYVAGRVFVAWSSPDTLGPEWKDYRFGSGSHDAGDAAPLTSFVTDDKGVVALHLILVPPDDHAALHSAIIALRADPAAGVVVPPPLTLTLKPKEDIVGIKPLAAGSRFAENGFARFAIVMLDADGHRRASDDLGYQIYEQGRSFDWYQAEGRWNYKLEQQRRRVGGGTLELGADGDDVIEWPVVAGNYRLEITDANGAVRAAVDFSAGPGVADEAPYRAPLALQTSMNTWQAGQPLEARFTLEKPSMVTAIIGDDHIRKLIHQPMPAGENKIAFTPGKDWSGTVSLAVQSETPSALGRASFPRLADAHAPAMPENAKAAEDALTFAAAFPVLLREGDAARFGIDVTNNSATSQTLRYVLSAAPNLKLDGAGGTLAVPAGQTRRIPLGLSALHEGAASVKLDLTGLAHLHASHEWNITVVEDAADLGPGVRQRIEPQQSTSWPPAEKANDKNANRAKTKGENILFLSSSSLYGAPSLLPALVASEPFTAGEVADVSEALRLWHGPIVAAGLMPEAAVEVRQAELLLRLLAQQRPDGGFSPLPGSAPGEEDLITTSRVLVALSHGDPPPAKTAADRAAAWLKQRLDNTWFDEHERPARAAAYAALAEASRMDNASLHYFSDTSAKTQMPMDASLDLAFAFARIGDQPASAFWIETSGVKKDASSLTPPLLPFIAGNPFADTQLITPEMEAFAAPDAVKNAGVSSLANFLRAAWMIQNRKGAWRVMVGSDKRNPKDVLVVTVPMKAPPPVIHNTGDDPLFLYGAMRAEAKTIALGAARHIYHLDGAEADSAHPLTQGEVYLVVLEGSWPGGVDSLLVHDNLSPALRELGCLPPSPIDADDQLAWLKNQTLTASLACEGNGGDVDALLTRKENGSTASWRVAYLAKADMAGAFGLAPAKIYGVNADNGAGFAALLRTPAQNVEIR